MITDAIIQFFGGLIFFFINAFPAVTLDLSYANGLNQIVSQMSKFSSLFPLTALLYALSIVISFEIAFFGFRLIMWAYHQVWGSR